MRRLITALVALVLAASVSPAFALLPGTDIIVPAAGRGGVWVTDLYVANAGNESVSGTVEWLVRGQANPNPMSIPFDLDPGETLVYADIINADFGLASGNGAFRVTASDVVIVNSRIYAAEGSATFGQGFEGVPVSAATGTGDLGTVVGLSFNDSFRTNIYATAGADGASATLRLLDTDGTNLASSDIVLGAWEPYLKRVDQVFPGIGNFDNATLSADVTAGSLVVGGSKVDNASTDPTTLESDATAGSASSDGVYQISIYDPATYAAGGNIVIDDGIVTQINGTYFNWEKEEAGEPACTLQFLWGIGMSPTPLADFATGVTFSDSYESSDSGDMEWTVVFTVENNMEIIGTITAVGSDFTLDGQLGCNGDFPELDLRGGKTE